MSNPQVSASSQQVHANNVATYINQGIALVNQRRFEEALASYDQALQIQPRHADALCNRGNALISLNRIQDALDSYEQALAIQPQHMQALSNRGNILLLLNRYEDALDSYDRALAIQPNYADALSNRGAVLIKLNRFEEAVTSFSQGLAIQPKSIEALSNRGNALRQLNRLEEALSSLQQALAIKPDYADAHWNEALCRLNMGDFALGWQKYEWRWKSKTFIHIPRNFSQPLWLGQESLHNKTILLHAEQGLGDTIQFCRYATKVAALGATVILEVQPALKTLLRNITGVTRIITYGEALPRFDYHCPLLSLPLAFRTDLNSIPFAAETNATTTRHSYSIRSISDILLCGKRFLSSLTKTNSVPASAAYYIRANARQKSTWTNKLRLNTQTSPRIGLTWSGNPVHTNDHNRSIALMDFTKIINGQNQGQCKNQAQFYCLQKEIRAKDQALLTKLHIQKEIVFVGNDLKDFSDTAALIDLMDLVITVDTSIAHLAGAMGKPVWILLPFNADWRWLTKRNDSPWYPSARLFRQPAMGDWDSVINDIKQALSNKEFA